MYAYNFVRLYVRSRLFRQRSQLGCHVCVVRAVPRALTRVVGIRRVLKQPLHSTNKHAMTTHTRTFTYTGACTVPRETMTNAPCTPAHLTPHRQERRPSPTTYSRECYLHVGGFVLERVEWKLDVQLVAVIRRVRPAAALPLVCKNITVFV